MIKVSVLVVSVLASGLLHASTGTERLKTFFADVSAVRADFNQKVLGAEQQTLQETSGQMLLLRPGNFRWDYHKPYEQQIVSNGKKVWLYDVDLEQVTIKTIDGTLGNTPALLLSSDVPIEENFTVRELGDEQNLKWVELVPLQKESSFERLVLGFNEENLVTMELHDAFGQLTRLHFSKIERNPVIDPGKFNFIPPANVDVIGE